MSPAEEQTEKLYYSIGEVSRMLDVNSSLIRFWEKEFSVVKPRKNRKGNRLFTASDIETLKLIHLLVKDRGMTLEGARQALSQKRKKVDARFETIRLLEELKLLLAQMKKTL
ncbi:MAG: MerR family transcriptional regulator [Bacteroidia bacterium]